MSSSPSQLAGGSALTAAVYYLVFRAQHPLPRLQTMVTFWPNLLVSEFSQHLLLLMCLALSVARKRVTPVGGLDVERTTPPLSGATIASTLSRVGSCHHTKPRCLRQVTGGGWVPWLLCSQRRW